jgi:restriction system protein
MNIPDYQTIMLPLLEATASKKNHRFQDLVENLAKKFKLTEKQLKELLPSGSQPIFDNRVGWAKTYLKKAGLLKSEKRGFIEITDKGLEVIKKKPSKIDNKFLEQFDGYIQFKSVKKDKNNETTIKELEEIEDDKNPEELLEFSFLKLNEELANEVLEKVKSCSYYFFENLVVDLLLKMGYGGSRKDAGEAMGKSGDGGIDGIIKEDRLGLDIIYIQAKKWENTVPVKEIRDFAGSLLAKKAKKGIFISTSNFPKSAYDFVRDIDPKIVLIGGKELAKLMIEHNVGLTAHKMFELKRIDSDYFEKE